MAQLYDQIGIGYNDYRRPDPRIATAITRALDDADTVVNVGAGTGSYEPVDRASVTAPGNADMASSCTSPSSIWGTGLSLRTVGAGERPHTRTPERTSRQNIFETSMECQPKSISSVSQLA